MKKTYKFQRILGWFSDRFSMLFVKRGAWLGDVKIIVLYCFLQCLLSVGLFTQSKYIINLSSKWWVFFGRAVGTTFSSILGSKVLQKWVENHWKTWSAGLPNCSWKTCTEELQKCSKRDPKMRSQKVIFLMLFKGLGPRVPQGAPRDPLRTPKVSPKVPKWSPKPSKKDKKINKKRSRNDFESY